MDQADTYKIKRAKPKVHRIRQNILNGLGRLPYLLGVVPLPVLPDEA
jgi:hypothetical protein